MIHRIRIYMINADLTRTQLLSFRASGTQDEVEELGRRLWTRLMERNPGIAMCMDTDWPRSVELGGQHVMPARPAVDWWNPPRNPS